MFREIRPLRKQDNAHGSIQSELVKKNKKLVWINDVAVFQAALWYMVKITDLIVLLCIKNVLLNLED